jgi:hypothetical protein
MLLVACAQTSEQPSEAARRMAMIDDQAKAMCSLSERFAKGSIARGAQR